MVWAFTEVAPSGMDDVDSSAGLQSLPVSVNS